ncbi:hypothetical protein Droror1_Dr00020643 [Drosera rotundifolia]
MDGAPLAGGIRNLPTGVENGVEVVSLARFSVEQHNKKQCVVLVEGFRGNVILVVLLHGRCSKLIIAASKLEGSGFLKVRLLAEYLKQVELRAADLGSACLVEIKWAPRMATPVIEMVVPTSATFDVLGFPDSGCDGEGGSEILEAVEIIEGELEQKLKCVQDVCSGVILGKELVHASANVLTLGAQIR